MAVLDRWSLELAAEQAALAEDARVRAENARWWGLAAGTPDTPCAGCGIALHTCELREGWTTCVVCETGETS